MSRVLLVGAGVVGLTSAVRLLEAGHRVDVLARDQPLETTSAVAAALWYPYLAAPAEQVAGWSAVSYRAFSELAADEATAVRMLSGTEALSRATQDPWWAGAVPDLARARVPGYPDGWSFTAPVIEMPRYLPWLQRRVEDLGGTVSRLNLSALPEPPQGGVVVNCSAIGSRLLADDRSVIPVRGQVVYVEHPRSGPVERWSLDADGPTYVVPRSRDIVVGGTEEHGEWSRTPSAATTSDILERATRLVPELAGARVLGTRVGLRPARASVRVQRVGDVVHCYGQGGSGVTVSWGCAEDVLQLVDG